MADDDLNAEFDWTPYGRSKFEEWGAVAKARPGQVRFFAARLRGCPPLEAYRQAGYEASNDNSAKVQAQKVDTSQAVQRLRKIVEAQAGDRSGPVTVNEAKLILSEFSRTADANARVQAIKALQVLNAEEAQREAAEKARSAEEIFPAALKMAPDFGVAFAAELYLRKHGCLPFASAAFMRLGPIIPHCFPDQWRQWKEGLPGHEAAFAALEAGDLPAGWSEEERTEGGDPIEGAPNA